MVISHKLFFFNDDFLAKSFGVVKSAFGVGRLTCWKKFRQLWEYVERIIESQNGLVLKIT